METIELLDILLLAGLAGFIQMLVSKARGK